MPLSGDASGAMLADVESAGTLGRRMACGQVVLGAWDAQASPMKCLTARSNCLNWETRFTIRASPHLCMKPWPQRMRPINRLAARRCTW